MSEAPSFSPKDRNDLPLLCAAPMEGLTTRIWRRLHAERFGNADSYYVPFTTPTSSQKFTPRQLLELAPEVNEGLPVVPQLLTSDANNFLWAVKALADMGYKEVNLNMGCPSGTVDAKGRGAGMLRDSAKMRAFFDAVFSHDLPLPITVKTRLGWQSQEEFADLLAVFSDYPIAGLIVHLRCRNDFYCGGVKEETFARIYPSIHLPLGYNGDLTNRAQMLAVFSRFPQLKVLMVGRALMADPALFRRYRGGKPASKEEIFGFTDELFYRCAEAFQSQNNALERLKEYWFYQVNLFTEMPRLEKNLFRAKNTKAFFQAMNNYRAEAELLDEPRCSWKKAARNPDKQ